MDEAENPSQTDGVSIAGFSGRDELMSVKINVGSRRLFAALCENDRGRFVKLTDGRSKIIVPGDGILQMRKALINLEISVQSAPESKEDSRPSNGQPGPVTDDPKPELIGAQRFLSEGRKFYFDVLENNRGRYVKISQSSTRRITIIMPVTGLTLLREGLDMLLEKAPPDTTTVDPSSVLRMSRTVERVTSMKNGVSVMVNIVQREIRVLGKRIVFESGANRRGSYIKMSENSGSQRMSIMLPHSAVPEMIALLQEVVQAGDPADALSEPVNEQD